MVGRGRARQHEDTGADHGANPEQHQRARAKGAVELVRCAEVAEIGDRLGREQLVGHGVLARPAAP
jgi:hypothetical protein